LFLKSSRNLSLEGSEDYVRNIESNQREHLSVISCINVAGGKIPNFYILKGTYFLQNYIKNYEPNAVVAMQPNTWMTK
jgi:hypothetical protein